MNNQPFNYPYNFFPNQPVVPAVQSSQPKWVQGKEAAKAYPVAPGDTALLMDSEGKYFYVKQVNPYGVPEPLRVFKYEEVFEESQEALPKEVPDPDLYLTREEFERTMEQINKRLDSKFNRRGQYNAKEQSVQHVSSSTES